MNKWIERFLRKIVQIFTPYFYEEVWGVKDLLQMITSKNGRKGMDIDLLNNEFYNEYAESFDKIPFEDTLTSLILNYLPEAGCNILEIGSGAGALALWMTRLGHNVTCVEPAEKLAEKARSKGLSVSITKFQDYSESQKFDGIVAISSLIHIPRSEMPSQIQKISQLLKFEGTAFVSFLEGNCEGYEDPTGKGMKRFFSKFTQEELKTLLSPHFSILEICKIEVKKMNQSFLLMVLKPI